MKPIIIFSAFLLTSISAFAQFPSHDGESPNNHTVYKKYVDKMHGFEFQYPNDWIKQGKATDVTGLNNTVTSIIVTFIDNSNKVNFTLEYYLSPEGNKYYQYAAKQYKSSQGWYVKDSKEIMVGGNKAFVANMTTMMDGKGHQLSEPVKTVIVTFLDKQQSGTIKLQLSVADGKQNEVKDFNEILSSFKFISVN